MVPVQLGNNCTFKFMKTQAGNAEMASKCRSKKNPKMNNIFPTFKFVEFVAFLDAAASAVQL